jgi:hypothetical protein
LFADKVWYVKSKEGLSAFLLKPSALEWSKKNGGAVVGFDSARRGDS